MKGDFTRNTLDPKKHYRDVLLQQGRAQVDADWNEQAALTARRDETTAVDIIGDCGGPADDAAFAVITRASNPPKAQPPELSVETGKAQQPPYVPIIPALPPGDFFLSAGRYYVDGIQCENEQPVRYTAQPDRLDVKPLEQGTYLLYLDVWQRHLTALEDGSIRESALGGPDTATRVKTIWQVRALALGSFGVLDTDNPCGLGADAFNGLFDPGTAMLKADTAAQQAPNDPCLVPPGAGYTGLENQLYRVEIHGRERALSGATNVVGDSEVTMTGGSNALRARWPTFWKWSRENGSVVTPIEKIDAKKITVSSLGPDKNLGFTKDAWVEILDDALELESQPGQLAQIDDVDEATRIITLKTAVSSLTPPSSSNPNGVMPERHPKLRRWEGVAPIQFGKWLPLESGVQVNFAANGDYRTGHYWQIAARAATAQSTNGEIEWPENKATRVALPPRGITHHFCRLGIVTVKNDSSIAAIDCRCLWPALTQIPRLFYVSGDGQEVMPDLIDKSGKRYKLPRPLIVGLGNGQCAPPGTKVRFNVILPGDGRVDAAPSLTTPTGQTVDLPIGADGMARCDFHLDRDNYSQQVRAQLLDAAGTPCSLPIIFNATLSVAREVAYNPGECKALETHKTVQGAIAGLAGLVRIDKVGGDGQDTDPEKDVPNGLSVLVSNACGPVKGAMVAFTVAGGLVAKNAAGLGASSATKSVDVQTNIHGKAECHWRTAAAPATQELSAEIVAVPAGLAMEERKSVLFTANLRPHSGDCCCVTVGKEGQFERLDAAFEQLLWTEKRTDICICLMPGNHQLPEGLKIESALDRGVCVRIAGCGLACRLSMDDKQVAALNLASFTLTDLCLIALNQTAPAITIVNCALVTITGCYFFQQQKDDPHDLLTIVRAHRTILADNMIESYWEETRMKALGIETPAIFQPGAFDTPVREAARKLVTGGEKAQREFVKAFRTTLPKKPTSDLRTKTANVDGIIEEIDTIDIKGEDKNEAIAAVRELMFQLVIAPAVAIADADAETAIVNNAIAGEVRIYGTSGALLQTVSNDLALGIRNRKFILGKPSKCSLRIEGNILYNVVVDRQIIQPNPKEEKGTPNLVGLFARMSLLDNTFHVAGQQWLAAHVISNGNHFIQPKAAQAPEKANGGTFLYLGTVVGASFICVGTSCNFPAEVGYSLALGGGFAFKESANLITLRAL